MYGLKIYKLFNLMKFLSFPMSILVHDPFPWLSRSRDVVLPRTCFWNVLLWLGKNQRQDEQLTWERFENHIVFSEFNTQITQFSKIWPFTQIWINIRGSLQYSRKNNVHMTKQYYQNITNYCWAVQRFFY